MRRAALAAGLLYVASCSVGGSDRAIADIRDAEGRTVARAYFEADGESTRVRVEAIALPAGSHGIHVHEVGSCVAPDFLSAGNHFNPGAQAHHGAGDHHAGDLPNIGPAGLEATLKGITPRGRGHHSLFHKGGTSVVIHRDTDDMVSAPSGNSGPRIACGVIRAN